MFVVLDWYDRVYSSWGRRLKADGKISTTSVLQVEPLVDRAYHDRELNLFTPAHQSFF